MTGLPPAFSAKVLPWVLLAVSAGLNLFFVGGHVYGRYYAEHVYGPARIDRPLRPHEPAEMAARRHRFVERLGLNDDQRKVFGKLRDELIQHGRTLREQNREPMAALWRELQSDKPDSKHIEALLRKMSDNRFAYQLEATKIAREFMAALNPEQKERFVAMARERNIFARTPETRPPHRLEKPGGPARDLPSGDRPPPPQDKNAE